MIRRVLTFALLACAITLAARTASAAPENLAGTLATWPAADTAEGAEGAPVTVEAPPPAPERSPWRFTVAVYGWLAGVEGEVYEDAGPSAISADFEQLTSITDTGFQCYAEVRWRKWFAAFDGTWANLGIDESTDFLDLDINIDQRIFDLRLGRELFNRPIGQLDPEDHPDWQRRFVVDAFVGARYWLTEIKVRTEFLNQRLPDTTIRDERWDPFFGIRVGWDIAKRVRIGFRGDLGGFGLGDAAEFTWQVDLILGFRLSRTTNLFLGYRAIATDEVTGSGADRSGTYLLQTGPVIGIGFTF